MRMRSLKAAMAHSRMYGYDKDIFLDTSAAGDAGQVRVETSGRITLADTGWTVRLCRWRWLRQSGRRRRRRRNSRRRPFRFALAGGDGRPDRWRRRRRHDLWRRRPRPDPDRRGQRHGRRRRGRGNLRLLRGRPAALPRSSISILPTHGKTGFVGFHRGSVIRRAGHLESTMAMRSSQPARAAWFSTGSRIEASSADDFILNGKSGINVFQDPRQDRPKA